MPFCLFWFLTNKEEKCYCQKKRLATGRDLRFLILLKENETLILIPLAKINKKYAGMYLILNNFQLNRRILFCVPGTVTLGQVC